MPKSFWAEALVTACHVRNLSPSVAIKHQVPLEKWLNRELSIDDYKHLKTFGCQVWYHTPRGDKLDPRAQEGVMLGYPEGMKAYRIWDLTQKKIVTSRDVQFEEGVFPYKRTTKGPIEEANLQVEESDSEEEESEDDVETAVDPVLHIPPPVDENQEEAIPPEPPVLEAPVNIEPVEEAPAPRRSDRGRIAKQPCSCCALVQRPSGMKKPLNYSEALCGPDSKYWQEAIKEELQNMEEQSVWTVVKTPPHVRILGSKWVFDTKTDAFNRVIKFKARLVAQGFGQRYGLDYFDVSNPVVEKKSIRAITYLHCCT